ncbi:uncharacterized protein ACIBXB_013800 isoform 1-T1 [Morphnus guianensis]
MVSPEALRAGGGAQASCALRGGDDMAGTSVPHGVAVGVRSSWPWHAGPFLLPLPPFPVVGKALPAGLQPPLWAHHHPCVSKGPVSPCPAAPACGAGTGGRSPQQAPLPSWHPQPLVLAVPRGSPRARPCLVPGHPCCERGVCRMGLSAPFIPGQSSPLPCSAQLCSGSCRAKLVEMLPDAMMRLVLDHAIRQPRSLLALPATRRAALARGALRSLRLPAGTELGGEDLDRLGPLVGFLGRETVARVQPQSLLPRLGDLQDTCLAAEAGAELGRLLLSEQALGTPPGWRLPTLQQLGRLVFLLPLESLRAIPRVSTMSHPTATALPHGWSGPGPSTWSWSCAIPTGAPSPWLCCPHQYHILVAVPSPMVSHPCGCAVPASAPSLWLCQPTHQHSCPCGCAVLAAPLGLSAGGVCPGPSLHVLPMLPQDLLSRDTVEQLLQSQRDWEQSELGHLCRPPGTLGEGPSPQEVLVAPLVAAARPGERGETVHSPPQPCARSCTSCPWCPPMPCPHTLCPCCPCSPCCSLPGLALCPQCPVSPCQLLPGWCVPLVLGPARSGQLCSPRAQLC